MGVVEPGSSGGFGFGSFLAYLGYGYLDTWHGLATLLLLPVYVAGIWRARGLLAHPPAASSIWQAPDHADPAYSRWGRRPLLLVGFGLGAAGLTILWVW